MPMCFTSRRVPRWCGLILLMSAALPGIAEMPNAETAAQLEKDGRSLFLSCEFKRAARAFAKAVSIEAENARLNYWLGKSYSRQAELANQITAPKIARKARRSLEQAVTLDPRNEEYLEELFEFYLDSPGWFAGRLDQAEGVLEQINSIDPTEESRLRFKLTAAREDFSGPDWHIRRPVLWTSSMVGHLLPLR